MESRYVTLKQLSPYVKDMLFYSEFSEAHGDRVDLTVDLAKEWADKIDWESMAHEVFGADRLSEFKTFVEEAAENKDAAIYAADEGLEQALEHNAQEYEENIKVFNDDIKGIVDDLQAKLSTKNMSEQRVSEIVKEWDVKNRPQLEAFHTAVQPHKVTREAFARASRGMYESTKTAVTDDYNQAVAAKFAELYING